MTITEPSVSRDRLLGLGSKLYPSNMPRMLNKDLTRPYSIHAESFCSSKAAKKAKKTEIITAL